MDKRKIIQKAKEVCDENNIAEYPVRIVDLCKKYGLSVFERPLSADVSGFIVVQDQNYMSYGTNKVICVNLSDSPRRRRFTIAHELAHYILHREDDDPLYAHRDAGQGGQIETEANFFASNILMPEHLVREAIDYLNDSMVGTPGKLLLTKYIADEFVVSEDAAKVRLSQLKII